MSYMLTVYTVIQATFTLIIGRFTTDISILIQLYQIGNQISKEHWLV